ncbi:hypothetical protein [Castellaniella caeni]|uniref:hypothetical protein n=1 Tax=Castellaniella caeni TaxID=266123 RepID=UPI0008305B04|nr:hypothetical protein [Castellaniella caeni]
MHKEIERKFLVSDASFLSGHDVRHTHFAQAYLAPEALRYAFKPDGGNYEFRVCFSEGSLGTLLTTQVPAEDYATLQEILYTRDGGPKVMPRVRILDDEGQLKGLITAEVEFSANEDPGKLELPDWVGPDVSEDITYSNAWLAEFGLKGSR